MQKIKTALISVYHKDNLEKILYLLQKHEVRILSTGGTYDFIRSLGVEVEEVAGLTGFPSILDGRVKTLHPIVFGGILAKRNEDHLSQLASYDIPAIDLVIVDLYPFEKTVENTSNEDEIIEKIDIGGVSLIRAAAKNFGDVLIAGSQAQYHDLFQILEKNDCRSSLEERKIMAAKAFGVTMHYDSAIYRYFSGKDFPLVSSWITHPVELRYGENPHQQAQFYGDFNQIFEKLSGKELSYNNLVDIDAALQLIAEFDPGQPIFAILKHTNPCGCGTGNTVEEAWDRALAADPVSAFGGILISNATIDITVAEKIDQIFFEVLVAPKYTEEALQLLTKKKNRILLRTKEIINTGKVMKTILNGMLVQDADNSQTSGEEYQTVTLRTPDEAELKDLIFANKIVKHLKSNAIALVKNGQFLGGGNGQTSRVDATRHALEKAQRYGFDLKGAVIASDAFFPFSDSIELASDAGITAVIQPGGSIKDSLSTDFCNTRKIAMIHTGIRHFKH
jgi:phosphoribosylaminoimidazolecarboxamide formyltransferase / IMP cyclohydrolase